jgi:signal transduction histidine kinase
VIEDTGPGFDPAAGLAQGHGIGLKISRRMLEQAGGSLEIRSPMSASGGTRCTIALATI